MTSFWIFLALIALSSVISRAARGSRGGPPPVARPPGRPLVPTNWPEEEQPAPPPVRWPAEPSGSPRPESPQAGVPQPGIPQPGVPQRTAAQPAVPQPEPVPAGPVQRQEVRPPFRPLRPDEVDSETRRIAGEAERVAREAEQLASASDIAAEADRIAAQASRLGTLRPLEVDIATAEQYGVLGGPVRSDALAGMPEEATGAAVFLTGMQGPRAMARAMVLIEVLGPPRALQQRRPVHMRRC